LKDDEGNELLNIAFPELEGTNVANKQDSNGKYFVREVLTTPLFRIFSELKNPRVNIWFFSHNGLKVFKNQDLTPCYFVF